MAASTHYIPLATATNNPQLQALVTLAGQTCTAVEFSRSSSEVVQDNITRSRGGAYATLHGVEVVADSNGVVGHGGETVPFSHLHQHHPLQAAIRSRQRQCQALILHPALERRLPTCPRRPTSSR